MDNGIQRIILLFILLNAFIGLTGVCSCAGDGEMEEAANESSNITRIDWTSIRNANKTLVENLKNLNVSIKNPEVEEKIDYITSRIMDEINRSFSYETSDAGDSLKRELFFVIRDPAYEYTGPVTLTENFSVAVFRTITDPVISKPSYLSREYVVKYNITFLSNSYGQKVEDTIWWYESDASRIVGHLKDSSIGGNIAVIAMTFNDAAAGGKVTFVLEAEDLEKLINYWEDDDSYIRYKDWSQVITDNEGLVYYEDPSTGIDMPSGILSSGMIGEVETREVDEDLKTDLRLQSYELMGTVDSIRRSVSSGDLEETHKFSEELIDMLHDFRSGIMDYSVDGESKVIIDEYLAGIESLSKVGSHYWDKSLLPEEISDEESTENLREGIQRINNALGYIGEKVYDAEELDIQSLNSYSDYIPAGIAFHYKDAGKNNDISIKITDYHVKNRILLQKEIREEYQEAGFGNVYLGVVVDITHLGYRGKGTDKVTTPELNKYVLYYNGNKYVPLNLEYYIQNMGQVYVKKTLSRRERYESLLIFEIKDEGRFDPQKAYVEVDLGEYGKQIWWLSPDI